MKNKRSIALPISAPWPEDFLTIGNAGYYVALRIGFAFPMDEKNELPQDWVDHYTRNGLMLRDPAVQWAYTHSGSIRWSQLQRDDSTGVFANAAEFGLKFGVVISCSSGSPKSQKSYGTFARSDREITDEEIGRLSLCMSDLHDQALPPTNLTAAELEALELVKEGLRLKEIAFQLGVSEGAIKQRLAGAKRKLGAKTNTHAASLAVMYRLI